MRRNLLITPLVVATGLIACTDLLNEDPKGFTTTDTFYKTGADLNSATIAVYSALGGGNWDGLQGFGQWTAPELASDQARFDNREPNYNTRSPDFIDWTPTTGQTGGYWDVMYRVITRANLVLSKGPGISSVNQQMKDYNLAEAKFLRGYAYLWLTKVYDGVPLLLTPEEQANRRPTRTPFEQVHQAIIQDLTDARAALPEVWPTADGFNVPTQGRATKGAAEMALADLYLWRSSFLGKNDWQLASDWADSVIRSGTWQLNDSYLGTFRPANKGNREMIFYISNTGLDARTSSVFQLFYYPRDWGLDLGQGGGWGSSTRVPGSTTATGPVTTGDRVARAIAPTRRTCQGAAGSATCARRRSVTGRCRGSTARATTAPPGGWETWTCRCTATPRRS